MGDEYKKQIAELKTLVLLMHGDRRLPDYFQDMANDILSDEEERKQRECCLDECCGCGNHECCPQQQKTTEER